MTTTPVLEAPPRTSSEAGVARPTSHKQRLGLPALHMVPAPSTPRRIGWFLLMLFLVLPIALLFIPWQQSLTATGRVAAYDPAQREQVVEALIDGRIRTWHVKENQPVKQGQLLVEIEDTDATILKQLEAQKNQLELRIQAAQSRVVSFNSQVAELTSAQKEAETAASQRLEMARQRLTANIETKNAAQASRELAEADLQQVEALVKDQAVSGLEVLQRRRSLQVAEADLNRANANIQGVRDEILGLEAERRRVTFDFRAAIKGATASRQAAEVDEQTARAVLEELTIRYNRQVTGQRILSPCDGYVHRVVANASGGGMFVKAGDVLLRIVPRIQNEDAADDGRMVELFVDGNDAALITEKWRKEQLNHEAERADLGKEPDPSFRPTIPVRIQFEGWPAIQWVGWPSAAVGTYGGLVEAIDPTDDGKGKFRILVKPDPEEEAGLNGHKRNPWPNEYSLRQGVRANGWVLLDQVPLGWELWRRWNGFPPVIADKDPGAGKEETKIGKVKVPK